MACGACARRRKAMEAAKAAKKARGEKVAPAVIGAALKVFEAIAPKKEPKK